MCLVPAWCMHAKLSLTSGRPKIGRSRREHNFFSTCPLSLQNWRLTLYVVICAGSFLHHAVDKPSMCRSWDLYNKALHLVSGPAPLEEDTSQAAEEVEPPKRIFKSKEFVVGSLSCESGFVYTAVLTNSCVIFTSVPTFYCIELLSRGAPGNACLQGSSENG